MAKHTYTNQTKQDLNIIGVGVVAAGKTIEVDHPIENPSLKEVQPSKAGDKDNSKQGK